jgi:CBS domain containing-hemolysin-like protein
MNHRTFSRVRRRAGWQFVAFVSLVFFCPSAHASLFHGETLDKLADVMSWVVLIIAPVIGIVVFLLIHILPEKIAEKKRHPQAKAIQCLCLLSLVFGGLLWPLAWLWAYSKPVLHKLAYGTDKAEHEDIVAPEDEDKELRDLRQRVAELETKRANEGQKRKD